MDMITVLNTIPATVGVDTSLIVFIGLGIAVLSFVFMLISSETEAMGGFICSAIALIIGAVMAIVGAFSDMPAQPEKYQCTINDGVDAKIFFETFEIDSQEGLIYTVYIKEEE